MDKQAHTILIIDDSEQKRYAFRKYLQKAEYKTVEAPTGRQGLELAQARPDLIILDVQLPDYIGFDLCRMLKADPSTSSIPILQTSATFISKDHRVQGLEEGADAYLVEPIEPSELLATVKALIRVREAEIGAKKMAGHWQSTFDAITDGIALLDYAGSIERVNEAYATLMGLPAASLVGRPFRDPPHGWDGLPLPYQRLLQSQARETVEMSVPGKWLRITADPIRHDEKVIGAVCIVSDITARKLAEQSAQAARVELQSHAAELEKRVLERTAQLQEINHSLESLCYTIAHDLRAPLRAMHGLTSLMVEDYASQLDSVGRSYGERIMAAATRMDEMIGDLLTYGRLSKVEIPISVMDLDREVDSILEKLSEQILQTQASVTVRKPLCHVLGNQVLLEPILNNIMANALKFILPGTKPCIEIFAELTDTTVRLIVKDNGIGINPIHQDTVFKLFERLHGQETYPGTGLGLSIVKKGIERLNGTTGFGANASGGSAFWIELPRAQDQLPG